MITRNQTHAKRNTLKFDYWLLLSAIVLTIAGLIAIYDASVVTAFRDFGDRFYFFKNQLAWIIFGAISLIFFIFFDYHKLIKYALLGFIGSVGLLLLVFLPLFGTEILGAKRWLSFGNFTFQPSELTKLAIIIYAASIMSKLDHFKIRLVDALIVYFLPIFLAAFLVVLQPDLGTAIIFIAISLIIYFAGNAPIWHFLLTLPVLIIGTVAAIVSKPYRLERLKAYLNPNYDPLGASYQINQIIIALSSGGLFGVGLGGSRSKFEFIPEVHNDAIFAVIVEETGFIGGIIIVTLFLLFIWRGLRIARGVDDRFASLLAIGITIWIGTQAFINMSAIIGLIPLTGIPLPFMSYGGSALVTTLAACGLRVRSSGPRRSRSGSSRRWRRRRCTG